MICLLADVRCGELAILGGGTEDTGDDNDVSV